MVFISKKHVLSILAILCMVNPALSMQSTVKQPSRIARILHSTKTKVIVGVALTTYFVHRALQWYARNYSFQPLAPAGYDPVLENPKGVVTIFAHGLGGDYEDGKYYQQNLDPFFKDPNVEELAQLLTFDFQDSPTLPRNKQQPSCLGQQADIAKLKELYDLVVQVRGYKVNLYGLSRGASTVYNFLALYRPNNVNSVILESPFDDLESIVKDKLIGIKHIPLVGSMASAAVTAIAAKGPFDLQNYSVYGINPKDGAHSIPHAIPLLFICSKADGLIPYTSTLALADATKKAGHKNCYTVVADKGRHAGILFQSEGRRVLSFIKKFINNPRRDPQQ